MAINDQMEMALSSPAPRVDPVSGNEVPPGSLPVEVRDDIDVNLSEGEYVVPADVLRFHGVKFFEDLRAEAKMGLAGMDAAGRIGGEPVESAPMDPAAMDPAAMGISEEDIAMLEEAMGGGDIPATTLAKGGLMDKVAFAAMNDPLVNERINSKGMAVGFAEGGMTQSLYSDPTRIDSIIDKVMNAAQNNPALLGELSKRGVTVNTTKADMKPAEMQQANTQPVAFSHGGLNHSEGAPGTTGATPVGFSTGMGTGVSKPSADTNFNPFQYGLGYSSFGPTVPAGSVPAPVTPAPVSPTGLGAAQLFYDINGNPHSSQAAADAANAVIRGQGGDRDKPEEPEADPNAWMGKYDYSDPDVLASKTLEILNKKQGIISSTIGNAPFGQAFQAAQFTEYQANINLLKGTISDEKHAELVAAAEKYKDDRFGETPSGLASFFLKNDPTDDARASLVANDPNHWSNKATTTPKKTGPVTTSTATVSSGGGGNSSNIAAERISKKDKQDKAAAALTSGQESATGAKSVIAKSGAKGSTNYNKTKAANETIKEKLKNQASGGGGGFNAGGLMIKKK